ncbi:MAG TPA: response regulator [Candidatus Omnitrophota bacterium]|nr:response regulator [Candidatus Omnitrophota bacterium]
MLKKLSDIKVIGVGLALLYGISFLIYLQYFRIKSMQQHSAILLCLFGLLFIASIAVVLYREWGRMLLVAFNIILGLYLIKPYLTFRDFIPLSYVLMSFIIFMFFNQDRIKIRFQTSRVSGGDWRSILVIDDDETLIKTVRPILISHGFSVLTALTGEDGLVVARTQKPDIILLDVILPGIKGRDVCKKLKSDAATKDIPVVFFTAKDSADDVQAEKEVGANDHITKPVDPRALIRTIKNVLKS